MKLTSSGREHSRCSFWSHSIGITLVFLVAAMNVANGQAIRSCLPATAPDSTAPTIRREAVSVVSDTSVGMRSIRTNYGIPIGSASDVSVVQDDSICNAAMVAFEALTGKQFSEAFVIVRMGRSAPYFYLMTPRRDGALSTSYLLDGQFVLLTMIGGDY